MRFIKEQLCYKVQAQKFVTNHFFFYISFTMPTHHCFRCFSSCYVLTMFLGNAKPDVRALFKSKKQISMAHSGRNKEIHKSRDCVSHQTLSHAKRYCVSFVLFRCCFRGRNLCYVTSNSCGDISKRSS